MSLNYITSYDDLYHANQNIFVSEGVFTGDLNIAMSRQSPINPDLPEIGSYLQLDGDGEPTWVGTTDIAEASITHASFTIQQTVIDNYPNFKTLLLDDLLVSASIPIALDKGSFSIDHTIRGVFLVFVNYQVGIPGNNVCYEFKTETKIAPNNDNPNDGYNENSRLGLISSTIFNGLNEKFFIDKTYSFTTSFVIDTYTTNLNNTYVRFRCRKQNNTMTNGTINKVDDVVYSSISVMRIS